MYLARSGRTTELLQYFPSFFLFPQEHTEILLFI